MTAAMQRSLCLLAVTTLCACGSVPVSLADSRTEIRISQHDDDLTVRLEAKGACVNLSPSAKATVNGESVDNLYRPQNDLFQINSCGDPEFSIPATLADVPETTVAFEEGRAKVSATFRFLGTRPTFTVTPPADGHIRPGSMVSLSYSPAEDVVLWLYWTFTSSPGTSGTPVQATSSVVERLKGGASTFTIPANAPPGPATIQANGTRSPALVDCQRAEGCWAFMGLRDVSATFDVEP